MSRRRLINRIVLVSLAIAMLSVSCKPMRQFNRFFLTRCPEEGPTREAEFDVYLPTVSLDQYYRELSEAAANFPRREVARTKIGENALPIYHIGPIGRPGRPRLLVVAGIHGNETAGALAASHILRDLKESPEGYGAVEMHVVAPANPVGLGQGSRYNAQGCDVNRDFRAFRTIEAAAIRGVFDRVAPDLVLALHEGPHEGFFLIVARRAPLSLATAAAAAVEEAGIPLAARNNLGFRLGKPGIMYEGWFTTGMKKLIRIGSLADYAHGHGIGTITTEGPFGSRDLDDRIRAQVVAVRAIAAGWQGMTRARLIHVGRQRKVNPQERMRGARRRRAPHSARTTTSCSSKVKYR